MELIEPTKEMLEVMQPQGLEDPREAYIVALKAIRDNWEEQAVTAQAENRRHIRNNKVLQLRIEQYEKRISELKAKGAMTIDQSPISKKKEN